MAEKDTAAFFRFVNEMNAIIAANEARSTAGQDQVRLQRDAERRERLGQLRARPHPKTKTHSVRSVFGYTDLT